MKLYDELIRELFGVCESLQGKRLALHPTPWGDDGKNGIVLRRDMAYELGGGRLPAVGSQMMTGSQDLVPNDEIVLYGPDLPDIQKDTPYARIALLRIREEGLGQEEDLYAALRAIEYSRYRVNPHGYMVRISASSQREPVRVGKDALREGLDFAGVGGLYLQAYKRHPQVEAAKLIFITQPGADYGFFQELAKKSEQITNAIDHILKDFQMDCATCSLKQICDAVEGMRQMHFARK